MKKIFLVILILGIASLLKAQQRQETTTDFIVFWKTFRKALIKGDKTTIADNTSYPLTFHGERWPDIFNKEQMIASYKRLFNTRIIAYLKNQMPAKIKDENMYFAICEHEKYYFKKLDNVWKLYRVEYDHIYYRL